VADLVTDLGGNGIVGSAAHPAVQTVTSATQAVGDILTLTHATTVVHSAGTTPVARTNRSGLAAGSPGLGGGLPVGAVSRLLTPAIRAFGPVTAQVNRLGRPLVSPTVFTGGTANTRLAALTAAGRTGNGPRTPSAGTTVAGQHTSMAAAHPAGGPGGHRAGAGRARDRHPAGTVYRAGVGPRHGPALPQPAPFQAYPDLGLLGAAASGSASHPGGVATVAPTVVAGAPVAGRRIVAAVDVEVSWLIAQAPTVSPD
jgi:hypothetical protein